jgi:hypothetical protein
MNNTIDKLVVKLKKKLVKEYGNDFENFYLVNNKREEEKWEGIIASKNNGRRSVEYYTINDTTVVKEEKTIY